MYRANDPRSHAARQRYGNKIFFICSKKIAAVRRRLSSDQRCKLVTVDAHNSAGGAGRFHIALLLAVQVEGNNVTRPGFFASGKQLCIIVIS